MRSRIGKTVSVSNEAIGVVLDERAEDADELFALAAASGAHLRSLSPVRSTLEDVFLRGLEGPGGA